MKEYNLGLYEKSMPGILSWSEKLSIGKKAGFDYLEISIDESDEKLGRLDWSAAERCCIRETMYEIGMPICSMCLSGHRKYPFGSINNNIRARGLEIMEKAIDLAADMGIRIIQLAGYDVYYEEGTDDTRQMFAENLKKASKMAASRGINMGFETMETPFMDTVEKAMKYVKLINSPYLGIYPDIGNLTNAGLIYGKSVAEDIRTGEGHIFAAHLKETLPGHYRNIPFGTGHTDYIAPLTLLRDFNVKMFVGEFWYQGSNNWQEDLIFANKFLREKLDAVFSPPIIM